MSQTDGHNGNVLVVDDHELFRELVVTMLEAAGFTVTAAADGPTALEFFRANMTQIDCVLLDLSMPQMSGSEVMNELRKLDGDVRVVVMSGHDDSAAQYLIEYGGAKAYLGKPFEFDELVATVNSTLSS